MRFRQLAAVTAAFAAVAAFWSTQALAQQEMFIPGLVYRTGPYAPSGIPGGNGYRDYIALLNIRDKGVNGIKMDYQECETSYDTKLGVECYEKVKGMGPTGAAVVNPYSTGITYQVIPKAAVDRIPIHSMGYGMTAAADGRVFEYIFNFPTTYWSQASVFVKYIGAQEGGMDKLKGKKIVLVYHNSAYGKEPIPTLEVLRDKFGYELTLLAVDHPGQEQGATWLQVRRINPDWILLWGWGVMNQVSIKEAASINFKMDHMIGVWWSGSEADVIPAGDGAKGYKSGTFHAAGNDTKVSQEVLKHVYKGDAAKAKENNWGEVLYNRQVVNAMYDTEAIRTAMGKYGKKPLKGEEVRWGFENLNLTAGYLKEIGFEGMVLPIKISCADHEGNGPVRIQQWDGKQWKPVSDWIEPMREVIRPMVEAAAAKYAAENKITPRSCQ
jgi:branched-chain amino acid transport system substrate-binding protein